MERSEPIRLALEIDPTADPLSGWIAPDGETAHRPFVGWSGLAAALTVILDERAPARETGAEA